MSALGLWQAVGVVSILWRAGIAYPNPALTPGLLAAADGVTVCQLPAKAPELPPAVQESVFVRYGLPFHDAKRFRIEGRFPRELGGSDSLANLWPEPASPTPGFHEHEQAVAWLRREVCAGRYPLAEAQRVMFEDWAQVYDRVRSGLWP